MQLTADIWRCSRCAATFYRDWQHKKKTAGALAPICPFINFLLPTVASCRHLKGGMRRRIVMDPARWNKRSGPRTKPETAKAAGAVGRPAPPREMREAAAQLSITPASERAACLLEARRAYKKAIADAQLGRALAELRAEVAYERELGVARRAYEAVKH